MFEAIVEKANIFSWERSVEFPCELPGFAATMLLQKLSTSGNETLQSRWWTARRVADGDIPN